MNPMVEIKEISKTFGETVALADIAGLWPLDQVTQALSEFADAALANAARHILAKLADAGEIALPDTDDPLTGSGLIVLGLGKLGARELNYSSDIDLIVLYDDTIAPVADKTHIQRIFVKLARDLVRILSERTAEGYVFRSDLRLRPDPSATPPALSTGAARTVFMSTRNASRSTSSRTAT